MTKIFLKTKREKKNRSTSEFRRILGQFSIKSQGFTLVETLVVIFAFTVLAVGTAALFTDIFGLSRKQNSLLTDVDYARRTAFQFAKELRNSNYGADGSYALQQAGDLQIVFYSNSDSDSQIERVRYFVQNNKLYKGVTQPIGSVYDTTSERTDVLLKDLAPTGTIFSYYDGNFNGATGTILSQPVNVTQVKLVKIILPIINTGGLKGTEIFYVISSGSVRSLKTNLGD